MSTNRELNWIGLPELVVIARAAHLTHDRDMKNAAVKNLRDLFGVNVSFVREVAVGEQRPSPHYQSATPSSKLGSPLLHSPRRAWQSWLLSSANGPLPM